MLISTNVEKAYASVFPHQDILNFYMDDSGARNPDRNSEGPRGGVSWFGLGGVIIREADETILRQAHAELCTKWEISTPLHGVAIRSKTKEFSWLRRDEGRSTEFYEDLTNLISSVPMKAMACVIDRVGYHARYFGKHGLDQWSLCKTAFCVSVERAAKFALSRGQKLRVLPEQCGKKEDQTLRSYYRELREIGSPFSESASAKYGPLSAANFKQCLYDFQIKRKTSVPLQIADLVLHPICKGGYDAQWKNYRILIERGILIDCDLDATDIEELGVKYSCFDAHQRQKASFR